MTNYDLSWYIYEKDDEGDFVNGHGRLLPDYSKGADMTKYMYSTNGKLGAKTDVYVKDGYEWRYMGYLDGVRTRDGIYVPTPPTAGVAFQPWMQGSWIFDTDDEFDADIEVSGPEITD